MSDTFVSLRNIRFLLYEVHDVVSLTRYSRFQDHDRETFDMVLDTAFRVGRELLHPKLQEMDRQAPEYVGGRVKVNPMVRAFMTECGEGGWISAAAPFDSGGQQLPRSIVAACMFTWAAANYSASVYPMLTAGAAHLIESFGSTELGEQFIPNMYAGKWQGTMALTEPQAGSSLADITTTAEPTDEGYFRIRGQKIFISAGDHDGVDNVVHLMLARIKGAPAGIKGISLFVVPRMRPNGNDLVFNDVNTAGVFHKLGYRGCPITHLSLGENDDCRGWLIGEQHKGLGYMFQMMNNARIEVGIGAAAIASAAYYASLAYAQERPQGRRITDKDPIQPQIPIIEHSDVKRMLLFQRAIVEGAVSLLLQCGRYSDLVEATEGEEQTRYSLLLDLLTPMAKSYPSEMGIISVSQGLQVLGGYGYCDEFPLEQFYRDIRIHPIHEGTTGIQGMDLLGRKVIIRDGAAFALFLQEVAETMRAASESDRLRSYAVRLEQAMHVLAHVTDHLVGLSRVGDRERFLADATLYLEMFGIVAIAWQWLRQGIAAQKALAGNLANEEAAFYQGKYQTMQFFFHYELPKIEGLSKRLLEADGFTAQVNGET
ncbi:MAG: acyl-CoA dehydrogenase, partial [Desulfomonile tiedjei]|nr:acyl-CoA dehydrogenase [Desulfomonile tiedjei]